MAEKDIRRDSAFVIGHSANRNSTEWQLILEYLDRFVSQIPIGPSGSKVALVTYSGESRVAWTLNDYPDVESLKQVTA